MIAATIDFTSWATDRKDQLSLGSCVANSECSYIELISNRAHHAYDLSVLGLNYDTLKFEGRIGQDGVAPISGLIVGSTVGIGNETLWGYNIDNAAVAPPTEYYASAATQKITHYHGVALTKASIDAELALGNPVLIAADVPNWIHSITGTIEAQNDNSHFTNYGVHWQDFYGKHRVVIEGKNDSIDGGAYLIENSWGSVYGDHGIIAVKYDDIAFNRDMGYIADGKWNIYEASVIDGFAALDFQHTSNREQATQLYVSLFNRAPELSGLNYWAHDLETVSFAQVAQEMYDCTPARIMYPSSMPSAQIVGSFYSNVLGRTADAGGLAYWSSHLDAGQTKGQVITDMITAVGHYSGNDVSALASQHLLENKTAIGEYYAITLQADDLNVAQVALVGVTSNTDNLGSIQMGLSYQLGWI